MKSVEKLCVPFDSRSKMHSQLRER